MWVVAVSDSDGFPAEALCPFGDPHEAAEAARQALAVIHARHSRFAGTEDAYLLELNQPPCPRDWHPGPPEFEALTGRTSKNIRRSASGCGSDGTDADASRRDCLDPDCRDRTSSRDSLSSASSTPVPTLKCPPVPLSRKAQLAAGVFLRMESRSARSAT